MSESGDLLAESAEELYEEAPCGYLATLLDGTVVKVNRTFESWTGLRRADLLGKRRFQDLLAPGGRIYYETHYAPLLQMQGPVREVAVEVLRADGSRLPALINSTLVTEDNGRPRFVRTTVFEASDRRRYEEELLRARREEHEIAVQLQRGLLARELPIFEDIEVAAAYRPGRSGTEVGGDWYDAFSTDEAGSRVCFVVGDVVGHGIEAAAEMGQLRSAIRAFASTGMGPGALMEALDGYSNRHGVGRMATVACAELDVSSRLLRYVCAGHLPPVLAEPGERPRILWDGRSTPLAITPGAERAEGEAGLPAGASLFLYSDGLVERRSRGIDAGLEQLLEEIEPLASEPPAELAQGLIRTLHDPDAVDDVCLLVARPRR